MKFTNILLIILMLLFFILFFYFLFKIVSHKVKKYIVIKNIDNINYENICDTDHSKKIINDLQKECKKENKCFDDDTLLCISCHDEEI